MTVTVHGVDQGGKGSPPLVGALLRRPFLEVRVRIVTELKAAGFPDVQAAHLAVFQHPGPDGRSPSDLARAADASKQAMNNLLAQLERTGYLRREVSAENRRERTIRLTARGEDVVAVIRDAVDAVESEWRTQMGERDYERLRSLLVRLNAGIEG
ncbi:MAG: MarR family winged helix-turn-helix transcriptional regulator [Marmoricola sp.]